MAKDGPDLNFKWDAQVLVPASPMDAELMTRFAIGTGFRATEVKRRSNTQNSYYWVGLQRICDATDRWPTREHLHRALLLACGYHTKTETLSGEPRFEADSASFKSMGHTDFTTYFKKARAALLLEAGIDWDEVMSTEAA